MAGADGTMFGRSGWVGFEDFAMCIMYMDLVRVVVMPMKWKRQLAAQREGQK
ncbi:MAG: hypothetical protein AAF098_15710 [Pseudomonadota bacterium]